MKVGLDVIGSVSEQTNNDNVEAAKSETFNIRISSRAWEILRWAKYELNTKSYIDSLNIMNDHIKNRSEKLIKAVQNFDTSLHTIKSKVPEIEQVSSKKAKTILIDEKTHRLLEKIKVESNEPAFTFSDAIEFLAKENSLLPEHLKKKI